MFLRDLFVTDPVEFIFSSGSRRKRHRVDLFSTVIFSELCISHKSWKEWQALHLYRFETFENFLQKCTYCSREKNRKIYTFLKLDQ